MATKQINKDLEQIFSKTNFSQTLDQIPGYVFIKDIEGVFFHCNRAFNELFHEKDCCGMKDRDNLEQKEAEQMRANDKKVMENKKETVFIETIHCPSKGLTTFCTLKAPLFNKKGDLIGIIGHATEIEGIKDQLRL